MQLYPLLIAFAPIVMAFNFTGPDFDSKVNLSSPVVISWTSSGDSNLPLFDLFFHGDLAGSGGSFMYKLETNLTQSKTGNFTWDPTAVTKALAAAENRLSTEDDFYFEAKEHPLNGTGVVSSTLSESFAVEGYEHMGGIKQRIKSKDEWDFSWRNGGSSFSMLELSSQRARFARLHTPDSGERGI